MSLQSRCEAAKALEFYTPQLSADETRATGAIAAMPAVNLTSKMKLRFTFYPAAGNLLVIAVSVTCSMPGCQRPGSSFAEVCRANKVKDFAVPRGVLQRL